MLSDKGRQYSESSTLVSQIAYLGASRYITGIGALENNESKRMLILMDMRSLMLSEDAGALNRRA